MMIKAFIVGVSLVVASAAWAAPTLTVNGSSSPITVAPGSTLAVAVSGGPGDSMDWIGLYKTGSRDQSYIDYWYLNGTKSRAGAGMASATVSVVLPKRPGTYELRFFRFHDRKFNKRKSNKLATSPIVRVQSASVSVPQSIAPVTLPVVPVTPALVPVKAAVVPVTPMSVPVSPAMASVPPAMLSATSPMAPLASAAGCQVNPSSIKSGKWSDPSVWPGGCLPVATDHVTIPAGQTVTYDMPTVLGNGGAVTQILVYGTLTFSRLTNTRLDVGSIVVFSDGALEMGTEAMPMPASVTATIRLQDIPGATYTHIHGLPGMQPALHAHGGAVEMHGSGPKVPWSTLMADAPAGSVTLSVTDDLTGWKAGDAIVVTGTVKLKDHPTSCPFPNCGGDPATMQSEERVIASVDAMAHRLTLTKPLVHAHGGVLPSAACRACRQAQVANLTRNVVITSATPAGRRGHVHLATDVLDSTSGHQPTVHIDNAAFVSLGRPEAGSYGGPHLHMLGNAKDAYVTRSVIRDSANVWVRVHRTHFATIRDNIGYRSAGNGFSTEDGSEAYNVFDHNLAVQAMPATAQTNPNDPHDGGEGAGFWANTPRNIWTRNVAVENTWGYQVQRGNRGATGEPIPVATVDAMGAPVVVDLRTAALLRFDYNTATGSTESGFELAGGRSPDVSLIDRFLAVDNKTSNFASLSYNVVFDHMYAAHGGEGELAERRFQLKDGSFYLGQVNMTIRNSYVSAINIGYQNVGWVLLENVQLGTLLRSAIGLADTVISISGPTAAAGGIPYGVNLGAIGLSLPGTTGQMDVVLWNYDGPGQHVMLHQAGTSTVDTLTYTKSTRFGGYPEDGTAHNWQEARFTGPYGQGPDFAWPLRVDVGNQLMTVPGGSPTNTDVVENGVRWRVDQLYIESPPGMRLARFGYTGTKPVQDQPTDNNTSMYLNDRSLLGSHRTAHEFRYTVDLPNGDYWVDLGWKETFDDAPADLPHSPGLRMVDVDAQGVRKLSGVDVFGEVGLNVPLWKSFAVTVTNERLWMDFKHANGIRPTVSAIAVCPKHMVVAGRCP